jgi:replicative DNA helicase
MTKLPYSPEAEKQVLSCMFIDGSVSLTKALEAKVDDAHFHDGLNQKIWKTILYLHRNSKPIQVDVLAEELRSHGQLEQVGMNNLLEITSMSPTTADYSYWLAKLRSYYVFRELARTATSVREDALELKGTPEDFVAKVNAVLAVHQSQKQTKTLWQAATEALVLCDKIDKGEHKASDNGYTWPFRDWTTRFGSCKRTELVVVAARPSRGKSSVGRQIAWHWAETYGDVLFFSREMSVEEMAPLFAQSLSRKSWRAYQQNQLTMADASEFKDGLNKVVAQRKLHLFDADQSLNQVIARIRSYASIKPVKAIVLDYLTAFNISQEKGETRDLAIGRFTRALKDLALELKVPVVLLAQLSRGVERETREPRLSDLRESGNIEQDADRVLLVDWPNTMPDGSSQDVNDDSVKYMFSNIIQAKGRGEGCGRIGMMFNRPIASFESAKF